MRTRFARVVGIVLVAGLVASCAAACAQGGGGGGGKGKGRRNGGGGAGGSGGGGGTGPGGGAGPGTPTSIRLVGLSREALSPSATPRLWLFAERPAGADPNAYVLEESAHGVTFTPVAGAPAATALPDAVHWELPSSGAGADRYYRISAPIPSNRVRALAAGPVPSASGRTVSFAYPTPGATAVPRAPSVAIAGGAGAGAQSFLVAVADAAGTLVGRAATPPGASTLPLGGPGATATFASPPQALLAASAGHVAAAIALDDEAYGVAFSTRIDFTTVP